jgi:signal transduction histidine kinase
VDNKTPQDSGIEGEGRRLSRVNEGARPCEVDRIVDRVSKALGNHVESVRELADSRDRLNSFLHAVGHDIRAPLVGIDSTMELLALDADNLSEAELRARIAQASRSARSACGFGLLMIDELFELIRSDCGKLSVSPSSVNLVQLCEEVADLVGPQARMKAATVEVALAGCTADAVSALWIDGKRLKQAVVNVVANAVKFAHGGPIEIVIATPSAEVVALSVRDRGPGLEEASLRRIFEPFHQSERTASKAGEGLGLGLAIAEGCARLLGGAWTAANRTDGPGAEFTLSLPRRSVPAEPHGSGATAQARPPRLTARVLLVDDAEDASRLAQHHLAALGHSVTLAGSVREAVDRLSRERFDLVLSDFELGDGTAGDLVTRAAGTPVVISSARLGGPIDSAGAAGIVPKPVTRASLQAAIERVLGAFRASAKPSK